MKPRPLIIIDTAITGGPGRGIIQLASFFSQIKLEYLVCTLKYKRPRSQEFVNSLHHFNVRSTSLPQSAIYDPTPIWHCLRLIKGGRFNLIQSHGYKSHFIALIAAKILRIPWIAFAHGWTRENRKVALYHSLDRFMLRYAEAVVAVSPQLQRIFSQQRGAQRPTIFVPNAIDQSFITGHGGRDTIREKHLDQKAQFLLGCFGRLSSEKGQDILLRALSKSVSPLASARLIIVGDGPDLDSLQRLCHGLRINNKVDFIPHTSALRDYYEAIDLLVLPSRSEGLPNVALEAMSFGVPVVATDVGALANVITHNQTGWLVPAGNVDILAQTIAQALTDKATRVKVGLSGQQRVLADFNPQTRGEQILEVYAEALQMRAYPPRDDSERSHA